VACVHGHVHVRHCAPCVRLPYACAHAETQSRHRAGLNTGAGASGARVRVSHAPLPGIGPSIPDLFQTLKIFSLSIQRGKGRAKRRGRLPCRERERTGALPKRPKPQRQNRPSLEIGDALLKTWIQPCRAVHVRGLLSITPPTRAGWLAELADAPCSPTSSTRILLLFVRLLLI